MSAKERFPDGYRAGYVQAQIEAMGMSPYTDADVDIAGAANAAEARGDSDVADRLARAMGTPQPPAGLSDAEQSDWWLAFYQGRRDGRLTAEREQAS